MVELMEKKIGWRLFTYACCLMVVMAFLSVGAYAGPKDPFEPALDWVLDERLPEPLLQGTSGTESEPFKLDVRAIPDTVAPGQGLTIEVTITMAPGLMLYADKTTVIPRPVQGLTFGNVKPISPILEKEYPYQGKIRIFKEKAVFDLPVSVASSVKRGPMKVGVTVNYLGCTETTCFLPQQKELEAVFTVDPKARTVAPEAPGPAILVEPVSDPGQNPFWKMADKFGLLGVLAAAFIWGFLASLTPCVYPMIPVTVSVIGVASGGSVSRGFILSVIYVLGMSLTYAVLGTIAAWSGGLFGAYANHPVVRIIVAGVFVILALSMFDIFYIQTPSIISSKLSGPGGAGILGVFLTGLAAGAVVGPCVGPLLVALLIYIAEIGSKLQGFLIMWNFALGMGMLFLVIGTFSSAAASLPKAGPWMEKLKRLFGVIMLAVALYYVKPLLQEKVFILSAGAFLIGLGVFAGAFDALTSSSPYREKLWKTLGILCLTLGIAYVARFALNDHMSLTPAPPPKAGIAWISDEVAALAQAREQKKPMMIDFTADWCAACAKLKSETFRHSDVINASKKFVCLKVDCTDTTDPRIKALQGRYHVVGLPTIIFVNSLGHPLPDQSITEFVGPRVFLKHMAQVR